MSIGLIGGFILLVILIIAVVFGLKKLTDEKAADKFINDLAEKIFSIVMETIKDESPTKFDEFDDFSNAVIKNVYNAVWDFVSYTAQEELVEDQITKAVFKLLDKQKVVDFLNALFEKKEIDQVIKDAYGSYKIQEMIDDPEDKKLQDEYSDQSLYVENINEFEQPKATKVQIPPEELAKINPPSDDENEVLDLEDDTVELIVDKKEIIKAKDKNGNTLYYEIDEDGKKTRVSKEYALQVLGE